MSDRNVQARLKAIAVLNEMPLDAEVTISVHGLTREEYDAIPGQYEVTVGEGRRTQWTKDVVRSENVSVELFTAEPPRTQVVSEVTATRRNLRLMTE